MRGHDPSKHWTLGKHWLVASECRQQSRPRRRVSLSSVSNDRPSTVASGHAQTLKALLFLQRCRYKVSLFRSLHLIKRTCSRPQLHEGGLHNPFGKLSQKGYGAEGSFLTRNIVNHRWSNMESTTTRTLENNTYNTYIRIAFRNHFCSMHDVQGLRPTPQ